MAAFIVVAVVPLVVCAVALREISAATVVAFVLALLIAVAMGIVVAQTISESLRRLAAAATAIAQGDLRQELPTRRRDEIGSLAQAFDSMSIQIEQRIEGLSEKTQTLALEIGNLSAFGTTLAQTPDPHAGLRRLADMVRAMLDADSASVFLVYEGHTTRAAFSGGRRCVVPSPAADELAAWAVSERRGLEVRDAETDERLSVLARATNQVSSYLVVPLARQEGVVGALTVGPSGSPRASAASRASCSWTRDVRRRAAARRRLREPPRTSRFRTAPPPRGGTPPDRSRRCARAPRPSRPPSRR